MIAWIDAATAAWHGPVLLVTAGVYLFFSGLHSIAAPPDVAAVMSPLALVTAGLCSGAWLCLSSMPAHLRPRVFLGVATLIWLNSTAHLALDPQAQHATNLAVAILVCAIFLVRAEEFILVTAACLASFAAAAAAHPGDPEWVHFGVHMFECLVVASVLFLMKRSICLAVTRAQAAESAMRRSAEENALRAERLSAAKSDFLANMSHELRTPLNAIIGFSDMLRQGAAAGPKAKEYAGYVHKSGEYLLDLINQVLDLTHGGTGLVETTIAFEEVWAPVYAEAQVTAEARSVRLEPPPEIPCVDLTADPRRLKAALQHLVSNAIKFTPALGKVSVAATVEPGGGLCVRVCDDGIGIAPEHLEHVFEPFYQADRDYAKRYQGMGLGLALVRQHVRLHGGDVELSSVLGRGTTVRLWLPAVRVKAAAATAKRAAAG